jgi:hypothetical protein
MTAELTKIRNQENQPINGGETPKNKETSFQGRAWQCLNICSTPLSFIADILCYRMETRYDDAKYYWGLCKDAYSHGDAIAVAVHGATAVVRQVFLIYVISEKEGLFDWIRVEQKMAYDYD